MTGSAWAMVLLVVVLLLTSGAAFVRCEGSAPTLVIEPGSELHVGDAGIEVALTASDEGSGIRHLELRLRHAGGEAVLASADEPGNPLVGNLSAGVSTITARIDPKAMELPEGDAFLVAEATDWSWANLFSGNPASLELPVTVDRTPPVVSVTSGLTYVQRAGAGLVRYKLREEAARDGVAVGEVVYRGAPLPGSDATDGERIALFAIPRDLDPNTKISVFAEDRAGNRRAVTWPLRVKARQFPRIPIRLGANFLEGKVPSLAGELGIEGDDPVEVFQAINRDERARNEDKIRSIVAASGATPLFRGPFVQMKNSAVTSQFAEHRTYLVNEEPVSEAIHYGYDLASVSGAPIEASNAGVVLYAEELGIYGNCVILDHGLGLTSLYAHLSEIEVKPGDAVVRGQSLGRSGATGLAGGDHLHFAILVGETYVDPKEWWDPKWIREHVETSLP